MPRKLELRQRMQGHDLYAARERIRQLGNKKDIRGARKRETSRNSPAVYGYLDRFKELGNTLDFIKDRALWQVSNETRRARRAPSLVTGSSKLKYL